MLEIRLLGGVEARAGDGGPLDIGPAKCRALLAALALSPGRAVPVERLIELIWGDDPPRTAAKTLQTYVTRLRKGIGAERIVRVGEAYRLDVEPAAVDVERFRQRVAAGDHAGALAEWAGPPLVGMGGDALQAIVDGLTEQWLGAVEADLAARLDVDPEGAIGPLTEACRAHPFREGLVALLMVALYRAGRQAEALAAYREARNRLVEELGVEPGPALAAVEARILDHDPTLLAPAEARPQEKPEARLDARLDARPPTTATEDPQPGDGNLPAALPSLVGRDEDLRRVVDAVAAERLVTLVGPGGIGKTRLALAAADGLADPATSPSIEEAWFVPLAGVTDPADVEGAVVGPIGLPDRPERTGRSWAGALRGRRMLVVLDNCEHVVDAAAVVARALVEAADGVRVLATSREPLGLSGERAIAVAPLASDGPAVELFGQRAAAVDDGFDLEADRPAVVEICQRLDGLPLAIELAAARVRGLTVDQILDRLGDRLRLLSGGRRTDDERHRTLRSTIAWSYELLDPDERALFRRLSAFVGPFDLAAAEAVAGDGDGDAGALAVDDGLDRLVTRSMVDVAPAGTRGEPRSYRLLETIGQFGREELAGSAEADVVADRHLDWVRTEVAAIGADLPGWGEGRAVHRLTERWPDLRAAVNRAIDRGDHPTAEALLDPIVTEVYVRNRSEIGLWAERLLDIIPPGDDEARTFALTWAARRYMRHRDRAGFEDLLARHGEPVPTADPMGDPMIGYAWGFLADDLGLRAETAPRCVARHRERGEDHKADLFTVAALAPTLLLGGRFAEHDDLVTELLARVRRDGSPTLLNWSLTILGLSHRVQGRRDESARCFQESLEVELPAGTSTMTRSIEARSLHRRGHHRRAYALLAGHLTDSLAVGDVYGATLALDDFEAMMVAAGRVDLAHLATSDPGAGHDDRARVEQVVAALAELTAES